MATKLQRQVERTWTLGLRGGVCIVWGGGRVVEFQEERRCNMGERRSGPMLIVGLCDSCQSATFIVFSRRDGLGNERVDK